MIDMMEKPILNEETIKNNIENALLWLGYEDVEFTKRFSTEEFVKGATGEDVLENEILYQSNSGLVPEPVAKHLAELLEQVMNYHLKASLLQKRIKEQEEKIEQERLKQESEKDHD